MSLGLVSYDDSDESDNDVDSDTESEIKVIENKVKTGGTSSSGILNNSPVKDKAIDEVLDISSDEEESEAVATKTELSRNLHLPESKISLLNTDIDIKCLTSSNKRNGPVKISIPSLNQVEDDTDEPKKKKIKPSQKGSGLFALLPTPKSSLVPQSVINRSTKAVAKKSSPVAVSKRVNQLTKPVLNPSVKSSLINYEDSGDEDEPSGNVDFFSLDSKEDDVNHEPVDINIDLPSVSQPAVPEVAEEEIGTKPLSFNASFQPKSWSEASVSHPTTVSHPTSSSSTSQYPTSEFMTFSSNPLELDREAMQQLCGRRDRLKMAEVNLIDVSGDTIMPDSREWLTKQLTEEQAHRPSHKKKDGPTSQQKRKHQITYLAYQAKENELELKNQWANNRMSRKQTQAKYGF